MIVMLVLPLFSVITNSLSEGFKFYVSSISTEYVRSALFVTILATLVAVAINTFFGIMAAFFIDQIQFQRKTGFGNFDRYSIFHFTSYRRTCILDDIWKTWMDVSSDPSDQHLLWNEYPNCICNSRSHFSNHFRYLSICVKGDHTDLKLTGKRRRRGSSIDGSQWIYDLSKDHTSQMKWGLIYGIILCSARALGEFGAVNALSKTRGETFYLTIGDRCLIYVRNNIIDHSSICSIISLSIDRGRVLILRNIAWYRSQDKQQGKDGR